MRYDRASQYTPVHSQGWPFRPLPTTVNVHWTARHLTVASAQHPADSSLPSGDHVFPLPSVGRYQGLSMGKFYGQAEPVDGVTRPGSCRTVIESNRLLRAYADQGIDAFDELNGHFAAFVWDSEAEHAVFARDHVGVAPMYVAVADERIDFASDLRLLKSLTSSSPLDEQAVAEFLHYLYVPAPRTIYPGVQAVLPGHALIVDWEGVSVERYAGPRFVLGVPLKKPQKIAAATAEMLPRFDELLCAAIEDSVPSSGRIGLLLSSGNDSTGLAVALSRVANVERIHAMTVRYPGEPFDEASYARRVCQLLGIRHQVFDCQPSGYERGILNLVGCQDQPFGDPAALPLLLGLEALPQDVGVVLDGTGNGYFGSVRQRDWKKYELRRRVAALVPGICWEPFLALMRRGSTRPRTLATMWSGPIEEAFVDWKGWTATDLAALFGREISFEDTFLWQTMRQGAGLDWRELLSTVVSTVWSPHSAYRKEYHLVHETGRAMRFPYIDQRLIRFVNSLPQELQFVGHTNKVLLRIYLADQLPAELLDRPKGAFSFDLNTLLLNDNMAWLESLGQSDLLQVLPFWSRSVVEDILKKYREGADGGEYTTKVYALALLATWRAYSKQGM